MKTIVTGGPDVGSYAQITQILESCKNEFLVRQACTLEEFSAYLVQPQVDLIILDLDITSGLDWLARHAETRSPIAILCLGKEDTPDFNEFTRLFPELHFPLMEYIKKPFLSWNFLEIIRDIFHNAARSIIEGFSIPSLLQMLHQEKKTCTIRITSERRQGFLYLRAGAVINARYRTFKGPEAAYLILALQSPKIEMRGLLHDSTQLIDMRIEELLMEAARREDESGNIPQKESEPSKGSDLPSTESGRWESTSTRIYTEAEKHPQPDPIPAQGRKTGLYIGLIAAICVLSIASYLWIRDRSIGVEVHTTPPGAAVHLNGERKGMAPVLLRVNRPVQGTILAELPGHQPRSHDLRPNDQAIHLVLVPVSAPPPEPIPALLPVSAPPPEPIPPLLPEPAVRPEKAGGKPPRKPAEKRVPPKLRGDVFDGLRK